MAEPLYHYEKAGAAAGPVPGSELLQHGVQRHTLVWTAGMDSWLAAGQVDALADLFAAVPPPLPLRNVPPPLPPRALPVTESLTAEAPLPTPIPPASPFAPDGYSLPLLGKFEGDEDIWVMESGQKLGSFARNADLQRLQEGVFQSLKQYRFQLLDPSGQLLLTLYKPKAALFNPLEKQELHVLDGSNQRLGVCRRQISFKAKELITVEDAQGRLVMYLNRTSLGSRDFVLEAPTKKGIGRVRRSHAADWMQMLLEFQSDRLELIFEPETKHRHKPLGIGAVLAAYLFIPQF